MCIGLKQQYKFCRSLSNRPDRIVPIIINRNEFLLHQTNQVESNQQIKRNGRKQKKWIKSNQIKSNQHKHKKWLHNMGLTSMNIIWSQFHNIYQQYSILISIEHTPKWIQ